MEVVQRSAQQQQQQEGVPRCTLQQEGVPHCMQHGHKLTLYCLNHEALACVACRDSKEHAKHRFISVEEAALHRRETLQESVNLLKQRSEDLRPLKQRTEGLAELRATEASVRWGTDDFFRFLRREEASRLEALREEAEQKRRGMEEKGEELSRDAAVLLDAVRGVQDQLRDEDHASFLRNYRPVARRATALQDPRPLSRLSLLDVSSHLGNLSYRVWFSMQDILLPGGYHPVVLDPRTAGTGLSVSPELCAIDRDHPSAPSADPSPQRPGGSPDCQDVLGGAGLASGTTSWAVDTGVSERWALGVLSEAYRRTGDPEQGFWELLRYDGKYVAHSSSQGWVYLPLQGVQTVGLQLDMDTGTLSFWDCLSNTHLHSFTLQPAKTGRLFPSFYNGHPGASLRLLPAPVRVTLV